MQLTHDIPYESGHKLDIPIISKCIVYDYVITHLKNGAETVWLKFTTI
jgi:hypothetical protein